MEPTAYGVTGEHGIKAGKLPVKTAPMFPASAQNHGVQASMSLMGCVPVLPGKNCSFGSCLPLFLAGGAATDKL